MLALGFIHAYMPDCKKKSITSFCTKQFLVPYGSLQVAGCHLPLECATQCCNSNMGQTYTQLLHKQFWLVLQDLGMQRFPVVIW